MGKTKTTIALTVPFKDCLSNSNVFLAFTVIKEYKGNRAPVKMVDLDLVKQGICKPHHFVVCKVGK